MAVTGEFLDKAKPRLAERSQPGSVAKDKDNGEKRSVLDCLQNPMVFLFLLVFVTFVLYVGTLSFQFVWDDNPQIVNNPLIRTWKEVPRAFVSDLWYHATRNQLYYRPLFTTWSTLNYSVFALKTWGWHLGAVSVHILAVVTVFFLARKIGLDYATAAIATTIFALHPVHIECVAWISAASDSMVTMFFVLSLIAFLNSRRPDQRHWMAWRIASLGLLACALLTKEMALTLCAIVGLYAWLYPAQQSVSGSKALRQAVLVAIPYGIVTIGYLALRKFALHQLAGTFDPMHTVRDMVLTWPLALYKYLRILVMPVGLTGLYYDPYVQSALSARFWGPLLVLAGVCEMVWYWWRRTSDRVVVFAGLWILVTLAPVMYLRNFANGDFVRDRYVYLPSVGFVILLAKAVRLLPRLKRVSAFSVQATATAGLAIAYCVGCYAQQVYWGSELLVFARGNALYPQSAYAAAGLAKELARRGAYDRAENLLLTAIWNEPDLGLAYFSLAEVYAKKGDKDRAHRLLDQAATLFPMNLKSETGKIDIAGVYGQIRDYNRALALCSDVLRTEPDLYSAQYNCGNINWMAGNYADAERLLSQAVVSAPDQAAPNYFLGRVYLATARHNRAEACFQRAVALDPNIFDYHYWYSRTLLERGDIPDARRELMAALAVKPDSVEAKANLAALPPVR